MNKKKQLFHLCVWLLLLTACSSDMDDSLSIKGYDCSQLAEHTLEHPLHEISGICFDASNNSFLAVNDEQGIIYKLDADSYRITDRFDFAGKGDYEEIQMLNDKVYVLRSDGNVSTMTYDGKQLSDIRSIAYSGNKEEFESFYVAAANELILIPKKIKQSGSTKSTTGIRLNLIDGSTSQSPYTLYWETLKTVTKIQPSAVAVQPFSKEIYLLVSIEKRLIVLDPSWNVKDEYVLDVQHFPQPEGITFDARGNLYITNEGGDGKPTLLFIPKKVK